MSYVRIGDEGTRITFRFCPTCGGTVYYEMDFLPEDVVIPVGAFASPDFQAPTVSVYEERRHPWLRLPDGIRHIA